MSPNPRSPISFYIVAPFIAALFGLWITANATAGDGGIKLITKDKAEDKKHDPQPDDDKNRDKGPRIELALLLDTSNSMDGLIHQAQAQLWKIVNELSSCKKNGRIPDLRVALYEYGNTGLPDDGGWVRQVLPLSDNLDDVSEKLFALSTNGGDEYCGRVIQAATSGLDWSGNDDHLKIIVIAGNEPFTQGSVDYKEACRQAVEKGIVINTIFCGDRSEGVQTKWKHGAKLGKGEYSHINQNERVIEIVTPYDDDLSRLSTEINGTFLFYGDVKLRERLSENQAAQDSNALGLGASSASGRAATKAGRNYYFEADLTARPEAAAETLERADEAELPKELKGKELAEQKKIIAEKAEQREEIQKKIQELTKKRDAFIAKERQKQLGEDKSQSLDDALLGALRTQAENEGFSFEK